MHPGYGLFHGGNDVDIGLSGIVRMDPTLHTDLGGTPVPGFLATTRQFLCGQVIGLAAQVLTLLALGERAELTLEVADIGVVDVAVNDVTDGIAIALLAQFIGCCNHVGEVIAPCSEETGDFGFFGYLSGLAAADDVPDVPGYDAAPLLNQALFESR